MISRLRLSAILLALTTLLGAGTATLDLPQTLRADAASHGCAPVTDFYDRPGRVDPPYVYGYLESALDPHREQSAAYWCERKDATTRFLLVIWIGDTTLGPLLSCPRTIAWDNWPGGLSLRHRQRVSLAEFLPLSDLRTRGPDVAATGTLIVGEYDGVVAEFICHRGAWYVRQLH